MLQRHSSRRNRLDHAVLNQRLEGAVSYDRIAGYFRSSLFEVAGEAIVKVTGPVRIICNSDLNPQDLITAAVAQAALRRSWCSGKPEEAPPIAIPRYRALYEALTSKKIEVRVLPDSAFGLIHGKAGVVRSADGSATAFLGSVNESASAWKVNYELLWEDNDPETIAWVQEEFDALWNDARAVDLACCPFIAQDVRRIIFRRVIEPEDLKSIVDPTTAAATAAVETSLRQKLQMIFQDPYASLNPRWRVADIIAEPLRAHGLMKDPAQVTARVDEVLQQVRLSPADKVKYPHQFSGGQRQRLSIARALATKPEFLVCDEPTSALDVSVQAQVLNLMKDLQREMGLTYLFISHNLAVVHHISDRVGVMYLGRIVELATRRTLFTTPRHPYTRLLLDAIPDLEMSGSRPHAGRRRGAESAEPAQRLHVPPRCPHADERCRREAPVLKVYRHAGGESQGWCHAVEEGRI